MLKTKAISWIKEIHKIFFPKVMRNYLHQMIFQDFSRIFAHMFKFQDFSMNDVAVIKRQASLRDGPARVHASITHAGINHNVCLGAARCMRYPHCPRVIMSAPATQDAVPVSDHPG